MIFFQARQIAAPAKASQRLDNRRQLVGAKAAAPLKFSLPWPARPAARR